MVYGSYLLAAINQALDQAGESDIEHRFETRDLIIVAGAAVVIGLILVLWMVFFRKRPDEHDHGEPVREGNESGSSSGSRRVRRRRRLRRRDHRPRNATLGETGGLPPPRPEDQPPPF